MKRHYMIIGLLVMLFAAPGIAAYLVYTHPTWLKTTTNHGKLLQSSKPITALNKDHKWQLVYWHPSFCDANCAKHMDELARVRLALGRHLRQIDTILLLNRSDATIADTLQYQLHTEGSEMLQVVTESDKALLGNTSAIYIVNPQHHVILAYDEGQPLDDIFQDLKHLVTDR